MRPTRSAFGSRARRACQDPLRHHVCMEPSCRDREIRSSIAQSRKHLSFLLPDMASGLEKLLRPARWVSYWRIPVSLCISPQDFAAYRELKLPDPASGPLWAYELLESIGLCTANSSLLPRESPHFGPKKSSRHQKNPYEAEASLLTFSWILL